MKELRNKLLSIQEAAEYLGVKESRIRSAIRRREIPYIKLKRLVRFEVSDLQSWVQSSKVFSRRGGNHGH